MNLSDIKSLPWSIDLEVHVLSCVLLEPALLDSSILDEKCFLSRSNKDVFIAMMKLKGEWRTPDLVNLIAEIEPKWYTPDTLYHISWYAFTIAGYEEKSAKLIEYRNRREMIRQCQIISNLANNPSIDFSKAVEASGKLSESIKSSDEAWTIIPIDTYEMLFEQKKSISITKTTGYKVMDELVWWYRKWSLYVIWARPSMWKSTFALNLALKAIDQWIQCAFFSTEMPIHEIHIRTMSKISRVESSLIEWWLDSVAGVVSESIWNTPRKAKCNIYDQFDTRENLEVLVIKEALAWTKIMFIDYIQQVWSSKQVTNLNNFIGMMTTKLKKLAIKYGLCIVALAQLNRSANEMKDPTLKDFRDSWNIEQDIDIGAILHAFDPHQNTLDIHVLKNRHGAKWVFRIWYKPRFFDMYDI